MKEVYYDQAFACFTSFSIMLINDIGLTHLFVQYFITYQSMALLENKTVTIGN